MSKKSLQSVWIVLVILGLSVFVYFAYRTQEDITEVAEKRIKESKFLQELDKICGEIQVSEGMRFTGKFVGKSHSFVTYYYESANSYGLNSVKDYLVKNEWKVSEKESSINSISLEKINKSVKIEYEKDYWRDVYFYQVTCY